MRRTKSVPRSGKSSINTNTFHVCLDTGAKWEPFASVQGRHMRHYGTSFPMVHQNRVGACGEIWFIFRGKEEKHQAHLVWHILYDRCCSQPLVRRFSLIFMDMHLSACRWWSVGCTLKPTHWTFQSWNNQYRYINIEPSWAHIIHFDVMFYESLWTSFYDKSWSGDKQTKGPKKPTKKNNPKCV